MKNQKRRFAPAGFQPPGRVIFAVSVSLFYDRGGWYAYPCPSAFRTTH